MTNVVFKEQLDVFAESVTNSSQFELLFQYMDFDKQIKNNKLIETRVNCEIPATFMGY